MSAADSAGVTVLSLGGTIAMAADPSGRRAVPGAGAPGRDLDRLDGVPLTHRRIADLPSPSVSLAELRAALDAAQEAVSNGARGVVLTHGTDTLEESAFLLNRVWSHRAPLVLTGAMRPATHPQADGPANLRDAVRTAAACEARGRGVLAVMDARIHAADRVTKGDSQRTDAFTSAPAPPLGMLTGRTPRFDQPPRPPAVVGGELPAALPAVPVLALGLGDDAALLDALPPGAVDGLVVAGVGVGHVSAQAVPRLRAVIARGAPVVVATRIPHGGTALDLYGYPGSEVDLQQAGCMMAGTLRPQQARLLLQLLLARGAAAPEIHAAFTAFTG